MLQYYICILLLTLNFHGESLSNYKINIGKCQLKIKLYKNCKNYNTFNSESCNILMVPLHVADDGPISGVPHQNDIPG